MVHTDFSCKDGGVHTDFSIKLVLHTDFSHKDGVVHRDSSYKVDVVQGGTHGLLQNTCGKSPKKKLDKNMD